MIKEREVQQEIYLEEDTVVNEGKIRLIRMCYKFDKEYLRKEIKKLKNKNVLKGKEMTEVKKLKQEDKRELIERMKNRPRGASFTKLMIVNMK